MAGVSFVCFVFFLRRRKQKRLRQQKSFEAAALRRIFCQQFQ